MLRSLTLTQRHNLEVLRMTGQEVMGEWRENNATYVILNKEWQVRGSDAKDLQLNDRLFECD